LRQETRRKAGLAGARLPEKQHFRKEDVMATLNLAAAKSLINANTEIGDAAKETINRQLDDAAAPIPDTWVYRLVVLALGVAIFVPLIAVLINKDIETMKLLLPIATGALGALAGLLAPSPATRS
jgi:hypothetical protein